MMRPFLLLLVLLVAAGMAVGATDLPYAYINNPFWMVLLDVALTLVLSVPLLAGARTARVKTFAAWWIVPATLAAVLATQFLSTAWWPNSGDEYGYTYLADTLLHGRLTNPPPPLPRIFEFNWIFTRDGKNFSQYAPGFSALLAPFLAAGVPFLLNPLLAALLGWACLDTLRALEVPRGDAAALAALVVFSPFVLFNGASLYPHLLTAVVLLLIVRLQLAWEAAPRPGPLFGIGALFSVLLLTRYEVFAVAGTVYGSARVLARRRQVLGDARPMLLGGLPLGLCFLAYNAIITGRPWRTPFSWVSPGGGFGLHAWGDGGLNTPRVVLERQVQWTGELLAYSSAALGLLLAAALIAKARARTLRYYDLLFPAAVAFFLLFANAGGHRFGPRYWLFAWPVAILTIATGLRDGADWLRLGRTRLHVPTLAALHLAAYVGFTLSVALYTRSYVALRREVYAPAPARTPALVLIPSRQLSLSRFARTPTWAGNRDFTRNGVDFTAPVLYGRADDAGQSQADYLALACSLSPRTIYLWRAPGLLETVACARP
jgi:hypothetical protein